MPDDGGGGLDLNDAVTAMLSSCSDAQQSPAPSMSPSLYLTCCMKEAAGGSSCSYPCVAAAGGESSPAEEELLTLLLIELLMVYIFCLFVFL